MNILIIEDNPLKREKIQEYIASNFTATFFDAASYNSGINAALANNFDLIILDMSMPTFDRTDNTHGGRFRALAGKEIATKLHKLKRLPPFVVLTGYKDFSTEHQSLSIEEIHDSLKMIGEKYKGCIIFDATDSVWKEQLSDIIQEEIK